MGRSLLVWKVLLPASRADEGVVAAAALGLHWQSRSVVVVVVARQDMARIDPRHSLVGAARLAPDLSAVVGALLLLLPWVVGGAGCSWGPRF